MPIVPELTAAEAPLLARPFYAGGDPGPIAATLAHVPELMEVMLPFVSVALSPSAIDFRTKEIVILRTSAVLACRYCVDTHTPVAADAGLDAAQVRSLRGEPGSSADDAFASPRDRALLAWTESVAGGRGAVPEVLNRSLSEHFADHEIVELTVLVGATMLLNRYATTLGLPVSDATLRRLAELGLAAAA